MKVYVADKFALAIKKAGFPAFSFSAYIALTQTVRYIRRLRRC